MPGDDRAPLSDTIILAATKLVDDAQVETREPSHYQIGVQIKRAGLEHVDPNLTGGRPVGKMKRLQIVLSHALEHDRAAGERLVSYLLPVIRGLGGFRPTSPNYVGEEAIRSAADAFRAEGFLLANDGDLSPVLLDSLHGKELTEALRKYADRARRGADDAALLVGTGKDLLEATAAHVLVERSGSYPQNVNFRALMGMAFVALDFATDADPVVEGEHPRRKVERAMLEHACAINSLRNRQGTGHGRPWLPEVTDEEARAAIETMGVIAARMLAAL